MFKLYFFLFHGHSKLVSLSGISSFNGQKYIHKKCSGVHSFLSDCKDYVPKVALLLCTK